ncbi:MULTISPECIES: NADH:flavin oxidoreductase/NADH oxidase [Bacillaceae]|uniref:NADH:flavin oxidoreductase/NADH oxidase n=1 Tax=Bacillaceae TaxID=186817 RepID=UPI000BEB94E4|nr:MULTISPECIES: NADH:flavin oxidoreductase/NADH oxidase [unclassified Bacillus (in: firmicutes)]PEC49147.1 NADPH dehydrogenase [Bacillus sp. AFS096315]PFM75434.1 NADPH dehydrogenase [Bacillus sp. AFS077874]
MSNLFKPFKYKGLELKNRVVMPPMCQYSVHLKDGIPTDWHFVHYTSRAIGGTGLIIIEMTNVEDRGRISDYCLGIWSDDHIPAFKRIVDECHKYGAKVAIQIAHAGRKAEDTPIPVSSSPNAFNEKSKTPHELTTLEVKEMVEKFKKGVERAVLAGVDTIELHGAHGYLIHQFASAYTNQRTDEYGRDKFLFGKEVIKAAKSVMPADMPLIMRISALEYVDGGYGLDYSVEMAKSFRDAGVDIFHISSGGEGPIGSGGRPGSHPGYQVKLAEQIKKEVEIPVIAVGKLDDANLAESVLGNQEADLIAVGRGMLSNPYWANEASILLDGKPLTPKPYERAY